MNNFFFIINFSASIVFSDALGCQLFSDSVNHKINNSLEKVLNSKYLEKSCIPKKLAKGYFI